MTTGDGDVYRLDGRLEECTFLPNGDVRVVLRAQRTTATLELARGVGRACIAGVILEPLGPPPGAPPLPSKPRPKFRYTLSPRPEEPLYWSSVEAPLPGLPRDMQIWHLRHLRYLLGELASRATPAQGTDSPGGRSR